jgi:hypothetical protein
MWKKWRFQSGIGLSGNDRRLLWTETPFENYRRWSAMYSGGAFASPGRNSVVRAEAEASITTAILWATSDRSLPFAGPSTGESHKSNLTQQLQDSFANTSESGFIALVSSSLRLKKMIS